MGLYWCFQDTNLIGVYGKKKEMEATVLNYMYNYIRYLEIFKDNYENFLSKYEKEIKAFKEDRSVAIGETIFTVNYSNNDFTMQNGDNITVTMGKTFDFTTKYAKNEKQKIKKSMRSPIHISKSVNESLKDIPDSKTSKKNKAIHDEKIKIKENESVKSEISEHDLEHSKGKSLINGISKNSETLNLKVREDIENDKKIKSFKKTTIPIIIEKEKYYAYKIKTKDLQKLFDISKIKEENMILSKKLDIDLEISKDIEYLR